MKRPGVVVAVAFALVFLAVMLYSTMGLRKYRVEVCIEFNGRTLCRTASAASETQAVRTATDNACALLASGMSESRACELTRPASIKRLN